MENMDGYPNGQYMQDVQMYRYHYEKYMYYKMMADCYKKMYNHCMMMSQYHYKMCMYYENGGDVPSLKNGMPNDIPTEVPTEVPTGMYGGMQNGYYPWSKKNSY